MRGGRQTDYQVNGRGKAARLFFDHHAQVAPLLRDRRQNGDICPLAFPGMNHDDAV